MSLESNGSWSIVRGLGLIESISTISNIVDRRERRRTHLRRKDLANGADRRCVSRGVSRKDGPRQWGE